MRTLLLNATYEPMSVIDWKKAICMMVLSKVEVLEHYERKVRSASASFALPAVVRLKRRVPWRRRDVRFSRRHVYLRDKYTCQYCGDQPPTSDLTFDHVIPRSKGGPTNWNNIVAACRDCNQEKAGRTPEQAGMELMRDPYKPRWLPIETQVAGRRQEVADLWRPYRWWKN